MVQQQKERCVPFEGSCHCGAVTFSVDADEPENAISCNCSHCRRKGLLLGFFPKDSFTLLTGEDALRSYTFNAHQIDHRSEEHTSELQSLMRTSYAVICLKQKTNDLTRMTPKNTSK